MRFIVFLLRDVTASAPLALVLLIGLAATACTAEVAVESSVPTTKAPPAAPPPKPIIDTLTEQTTYRAANSVRSMARTMIGKQDMTDAFMGMTNAAGALCGTFIEEERAMFCTFPGASFAVRFQAVDDSGIVGGIRLEASGASSCAGIVRASAEMPRASVAQIGEACELGFGTYSKG